MESIRVSWLVAAVLVASLAPSSGAQFLPQSHLGRLVQSFASPLVLAPNGGHYQDAAHAAAAAAAQAHYEPQEVPAGAYYGAQEGPMQPEASRHEQGYYQQQPQPVMQQAPSQQRGIPHQYYQRPQHQHQHQQHQQHQQPQYRDQEQHQQYQGPQLQLQHQQRDEEQQPARDQGAAPSHNHHRQQRRQQRPEPPLGYQMGAYLGPQIDDKEIQGAFAQSNSADGEGDDDQAAAYGPPAGALAHPKAASGHRPAYDEEGADEEEQPAAPGPRNGGKRLRGAASQFRQRGSYQSGSGLGGQGPTGGEGGQLVAAANGYAPYGYAQGPVDLSGLMGGQFQVYQGDGSGFGPAGGYGPGYGPQQQQQRARAQAASSNSYDGFDNPRDGFQAKNNDIDDNDPDDD